MVCGRLRRGGRVYHRGWGAGLRHRPRMPSSRRPPAACPCRWSRCLTGRAAERPRPAPSPLVEAATSTAGGCQHAW